VNLPLTPEGVRPAVADDKQCGAKAPQPVPPAGLSIEALDSMARWKDWTPIGCDREPGHKGHHWAGLLHWASS
jgi:hypothetical protein